MRSGRNLAIFACCSLLLFTFHVPTTRALSTDKACELCQSVLTHVYYTYLQQSTRKLVNHRIKHNCKRYANYKRRCILTLRPKANMIFENMRASVIGEYRAYKTCVLLKECSNYMARTSVADAMPDSYIEKILNGTAVDHPILKGDVLDLHIDGSPNSTTTPPPPIP